MNIISNPIIVPFQTPNPDRKCRKWSRSWKNRRNKHGNRVRKAHQYNIIDMSVSFA